MGRHLAKGAKMSEDSISRQAAIDMFNRLADDPWNANANTTWSKAYGYAAEMIEEMPSAQPEPPDTNVRDMKEMAEVMVSKEAFVFAKDDKNYFDFISRETERRLMDRLASILKESGEVVVKMSDLRLNEVRELCSVQFRRQIKWSKIVRCRDCKHRDKGGFCQGRGYPEQLVPDDGYCDKGDRKEVKDAKS